MSSIKIYMNGKLVDQQDAKVSVFDHGFLYDILSFRRVESDAECKPVELVLQRKDIVPEIDLFHPLCL